MVTGYVLVAVLAFATPGLSAPASPSPTASATAKPLIRVPASWKRLSSHPTDEIVVRLVKYTFHRGASTQKLNLLETRPGEIDLETAVRVGLSGFAESRKRPYLVAQQNVALCDGQQGRFVRLRAESAGKQMAYAQVYAVSGVNAYLATYTRGAEQEDDPEAIAALRSLCPPRAPLVTYTLPVPFSPPAGWLRVHPMSFPGVPGKMIALWMPPGRSFGPDSLNITRVMPDFTGSDLSMAAESFALGIKNKFPSAQISQNHSEVLCNGTYKGWYLEYRASALGMDSILEESIVLTKSVEYVATYGRPVGRPEDILARRALDTLCPGPDSTAF